METEAGSLGYGINATIDPLDNAEATLQFRQTLTDFAATMKSNEAEYQAKFIAAASQQQQMASQMR